LGGCVREPAGVGVEDMAVDALAVEGAHHDDGSPSGLPLHHPGGLEGRHPRTGEVDVHRLPVLVEMSFLVNGAEHHRTGHAGVVEENVDPAELLLDLFEHLADVLGVRYVALDGEGLVRQPQVADEVVQVRLFGI